MDKAILIPLILWAVLTVVTVLKNTLDSSIRSFAAISFAVYAFIFKDDLMSLYHAKTIPYMDLLKSSIEYTFISLAILWPATLMYSQYMTESDFSVVIRRLTIFSAIVCAGFLYFS